jgi:CheY-like chemotaxis protein
MLPSPPTILCVDDDAEDLFFITSTIEKVYPSYQTVVAGNGEEALQYLQGAAREGTLPSLIILDINMPKINGKETLSSIKAAPRLKNIPIVVFSTSSMPSDRLYCAHYGIDMVTKPNTISELERVLQELLSHVFHH